MSRRDWDTRPRSGKPALSAHRATHSPPLLLAVLRLTAWSNFKIFRYAA
jgi:hypothetical protein